MEKELSEARLLVGQYEAKMKSLNEAIKEADGTKRQLEEQVDTLNEEVSKLQAAEKMHQAASDQRQEHLKEDMELRTALESQLSQHREQVLIFNFTNFFQIFNFTGKKLKESKTISIFQFQEKIICLQFHEFFFSIIQFHERGKICLLQFHEFSFLTASKTSGSIERSNHRKTSLDGRT